MDYKIPFRGLKEGKHQYEYHIDDRFFDSFSENELKGGDLQVEIELIKRSTGIESTFEISGQVKVACDRCLEDYDCPVSYAGKLFFEFGTESKEISDELIMIAPGEDYLEMDKFIYEFISLSLPFQKFHPNDEKGNSLCNPDMLAKLNNMTVNNNDDEIDDPRWDKLRDLIN